MPIQKKVLWLCTILTLLYCAVYAQASSTKKEWAITLPLRFTHLQNQNTLLSGVKIGRNVNERLQASLSVYHSFYANRFKAKAGIEGFEQQPLLFINGVGAGFDYHLVKTEQMHFDIQLLLGWGLMNYSSKAHNFKSTSIHYPAVEPGVSLQYLMGKHTWLGLGLGYRPILSNKQIAFSFDILHGQIPVHKRFPNGLTLTLCFTGML